MTLRLDREVVAYFKGGGKGWQTRINEVLRKSVGV
ncbi:MAG: BrnA antitoxin family protein [Rhizobiaceae bacterium]|nr:BrnA antitoxin family protein [Rhizobiaceae bacterium]